MNGVLDPLRLMFGTLTVLRVRPPTRVDAGVAGRAMTLAPLGGFALALLMTIPLLLIVEFVDSVADSPLLVALLVTGGLALLTRGMHLDGLADVADGLGSGRRGADAVAIMRKSDIGPFGVVTLILVVMLQVFALTELLAADRAGGSGVTAAAALLVALVASRALLPVLCLRWFPAASETGLGRTMAGAVTPPQAVLGVALAALLCLAGLAAASVALDSGAFRADLLGPLAVGLLGVLPAVALALRCRSRLGGVTGDVYGAAVETAYTAILVVTALAI